MANETKLWLRIIEGYDNKAIWLPWHKDLNKANPALVAEHMQAAKQCYTDLSQLTGLSSQAVVYCKQMAKMYSNNSLGHILLEFDAWDAKLLQVTDSFTLFGYKPKLIELRSKDSIAKLQQGSDYLVAMLNDGIDCIFVYGGLLQHKLKSSIIKVAIAQQSLQTDLLSLQLTTKQN